MLGIDLTETSEYRNNRPICVRHKVNPVNQEKRQTKWTTTSNWIYDRLLYPWEQDTMGNETSLIPSSAIGGWVTAGEYFAIPES